MRGSGPRFSFLMHFSVMADTVCVWFSKATTRQVWPQSPWGVNSVAKE